MVRLNRWAVVTAAAASPSPAPVWNGCMGPPRVFRSAMLRAVDWKWRLRLPSLRGTHDSHAHRRRRTSGPNRHPQHAAPSRRRGIAGECESGAEAVAAIASLSPSLLL